MIYSCILRAGCTSLIVATVLTGCTTGGMVEHGRTTFGEGSSIDNSVYDFLVDTETTPRPEGNHLPGHVEQPGYGLYSYALFPNPSPRANEFIEDLLQSTGFASEAMIPRNNLNIIYLPVNGEYLYFLTSSEVKRKRIGEFWSVEYNYAYAQYLLYRICDNPSDTMKRLCASDSSWGGPFLFTYTRPVSTHEYLSPPYLFVDLSTVPSRAFPEYIAAYKTQVKRADYTDAERLKTFRLDVLKVVSAAAEQIRPIAVALGDLFHLVGMKS